MRLIDADELKEAMEEHTDYKGYLVCDPEEVIDLAPTVEIPQWIPCSERLPKRDELVLVSFKTGRVHPCKYLDDGSENPWWSYIDDCCAWSNTVLAWMPLPKPYEEEGE